MESTKHRSWRDVFTQHLALSKQECPFFVLSTISQPAADATTAVAVSALQPRARMLGFRSFFACLPASLANPAPPNPAIFTSSILTYYTDARMRNVSEIAGQAEGACVNSGGGGRVEAIFWIEGASAEWRFRGRAYVLGNDIESENAAAKLVRDKITQRMLPVSSSEKEKRGVNEAWSFSRELTSCFGVLSPEMRGHYQHPRPFGPKSHGMRDGEGFGIVVGDSKGELEDRKAREHFRVVGIVPDEVEWVDLGDFHEGKRWLWKFGGLEEGAEVWRAEEMWP